MRSKLILVHSSLLCLVLLAAGIFAPVGAEPAWSAPGALTEVRVLGNVVVKHNDVSLADICDTETIPPEWKTILSGLNIGDAPAASSEKFIDPGQLRSYLVRLLESHGLDASSVRLDIPDKIVVRRESVQISQEQIENIFRKFIADNSPWKPQDTVVQRIRATGLPVIPAGHMTYEVTPATKERFMGNVTISVDFYVNGEKARTLGVTGRVDVFGNVYYATRPLKQNEIITAADLELQRVNVTEAPDKFAMRPDQVENRRVLHNIGVRQALELKDVDKPLVLKRGDPVMIVYDQPGVQVTAKGQVGADGGIGDTLAVINIASKKTIFCRVVDSQTVRAVR